MTIFIFGNPDVDIDSLPIRILPSLQKQLPDIEFVLKDPNEEWDIPGKLTIIDTVVGIDEVQVFDSLDVFQNSPRFTLHGFDALMNLKLLQKLGKLKKIKIIGVPPMMDEMETVNQIVQIIKPN